MQFMLWLSWKPIRHHMVTLNIKYKGCSLSVPNIGSIRGIDSKVDREGGPIDPPPPPASFDVTVYSSRPPGLMQVKIFVVEDDVVLSLKSTREQNLSAKDFGVVHNLFLQLRLWPDAFNSRWSFWCVQDQVTKILFSY